MSIYFLYSSIDEHLSWFHFLASMNGAGRGLLVQVSLWYVDSDSVYVSIEWKSWAAE